MGGAYSDLPRPSPDFDYFTLAIRYPDKIKIVLAQESVIHTIRQAVALNWPLGIQLEGYEHCGSYEIKFCGCPFTKTTSRETALMTKNVCCAMLTDLYTIGWQLVVSSDLARQNDLSALFFRKFQVEAKQPSIVCVSLSSYDSLQLINAPRSFWRLFIDAVDYAGGGIQEEKVYGQNLELKLYGSLWHTGSLKEGLKARKVLLAIFKTFDQVKYHFYGTANIKGTADCIFFLHDQNQPSNLYQYSMLSLNQNDKIRLIDCPMSAIETVREAINKYWILQEESNLEIAWEFKLKGYPWWADGGETVAARVLITMLFEKLLAVGWSVLTCLDMSRRLNDKGVFVLRSCRPVTVSHFCISLNETDKIRLINVPANMTSQIRETVANFWSQGIHKERDYFTSYELKLNGSPWGGCGGSNETLAAKSLMCLILCKLERNGWYVVCSADVSAKYHSSDNGASYPLDVHSWFVAQKPNLSRPETAGAFNPADIPGTSGVSSFSVSEATPRSEENNGQLLPRDQVPLYTNEPPPSYNQLYGGLEESP